MNKIKGINYQYQKVNDWFQNWEHENKKALLLWGTPGIGKTFIAHELAKEHNYNVIEFNTSDQRNKDFMVHLSTISKQTTFTPSLILLDEAGGIEAKQNIQKIIKNTRKPIILTANEINKLKGIRKLCKAIYIPKPGLNDTGGKIKDFRQGELIKKGSQGYQPHVSRSNKLLQSIRDGKYNKFDYVDSILILDSSTQTFGFDMFKLVKTLACWDYCKRDECLTGLQPKIEEIREVWFSKKRLK